MPTPEPAADKPGKALRPWIEVALPHPDVLANRFKEAEFAADLFAVDSGNAEGDYATPRGFFGITFLTEGLKRVLAIGLAAAFAARAAIRSSDCRPRSAAARRTLCSRSTISRGT